MENEIPRRIRLDLNEPAELVIHEAMMAVEKMPPDVRLTMAGVKLQEAKNLVSDFIDGVPVTEKTECPVCGIPTKELNKGQCLHAQCPSVFFAKNPSKETIRKSCDLLPEPQRSEFINAFGVEQKDVTKGAEEIFRKHFEEGMVVNNYENFKNSYPTLTKCILKAMQEYSSTQRQQARNEAIQECIDAVMEIYDSFPVHSSHLAQAVEELKALKS